MYPFCYAMSNLSLEELAVLEAHGEIEPDDPPADDDRADHSPDDERWLVGQTRDDQDDDDLTAPIDVTVLPPSQRYTDLDGAMGQMFGHMA